MATKTDTEIFANWDSTPEFEKVHILPFMDGWMGGRGEGMKGWWGEEYIVCMYVM